MEAHKTLITQAQLNHRIRELAAQLDTDYGHSTNLVLVSVLQGAKPFCEALSTAMQTPHHVTSVQVASYGVGTYLSDGDVRVVKPVDASVTGADVVIVEDIIDTGYSMQTVLGLVNEKQPASVAVCALLSKPSRRVVTVPIDYLGFSIEDRFVFGYGIDVDQKYRELSYIGYFE